MDPLQRERIGRMAKRMRDAGQWSPAQMAGRRWAMGCVSLEITQRCNLDCSLCYLSDTAEMQRDVPIEELFRRIDDIARQFGPNTDVQISGGDPTLRDRGELSEIVRYVRSHRLRASLFTNGILLDRDWLIQLADDGLNDVAFHVDLTQGRKGYASEKELNALRLRYIKMARGLPLSVIFNTTVFAGNRHEISALANFFVKHSDVVRFASFQLGANTGRGAVAGGGGVPITQEEVCEAIGRGAAVPLNFDALHAGHGRCNRYAVLLTVGDRRFDAFADGSFAAHVMRETADAVLARDQGMRGAWALAGAVLRRPSLWGGFARHAASMIWHSRGEWLRGGLHVPSVGKISFFTHSFMDACSLEADRIDACVFMAATVDGPMSMCAYNAQRDRYLLKPIDLGGGRLWQPLVVAPDARGEIRIPVKHLRGARRKAAMSERKAAVSRGAGT